MPTNETRLQELKQQLDEGTYTIDLDLIAVKIIDEFQVSDRRVELLALLYELTGSPPEDADAYETLQSARDMVQRRAPTIEAISALESREPLPASDIETALRKREDRWATAILRAHGEMSRRRAACIDDRPSVGPTDDLWLRR